MLRLLRGLALLILAATGFLTALADSPQVLGDVKTEALPLEKAIEMALANNLDVRWNRVDIKISTDQIRYAWGVFDPSFNISALHDYSLITQNAQQFASTSEVSGSSRLYMENNNHYQASFSGKIPLGTQYNLGFRSDRLLNTLNRDPLFSVFYPEYDSFAGLTITQPLLRDFGPDANLAEVRIARKNKEISRLTWESKIITAVQTVLVTYYEMQYAVAAIEVREQAIETDKKFVRENQRRMELGMMSPIDVQQAEVALSTDQENLLTAKNYFMERQFELKRQILSELNSDTDTVFLPTGHLATHPVRMNRGELMGEAFQNRLDYLHAIKEAEIQNIRLQYARNQYWPRLDLVGTYGYNGLNDTFDRSFSNAFSTKTPSWSVGVQASIPLGGIQGKAQVAMAKSQKEQAILKIKQVELNVSLDVETIMSRIETNLQSLETSRQTRQHAEEAMKNQEKQIQQGLISVYDALETKRKLFEARNREIGAMAELNKSYVLLDVATGTLLQKRAIRLSE